MRTKSEQATIEYNWYEIEGLIRADVESIIHNNLPMGSIAVAKVETIATLIASSVMDHCKVQSIEE